MAPDSRGGRAAWPCAPESAASLCEVPRSSTDRAKDGRRRSRVNALYESIKGPARDRPMHHDLDRAVLRVRGDRTDQRIPTHEAVDGWLPLRRSTLACLGFHRDPLMAWERARRTWPSRRWATVLRNVGIASRRGLRRMWVRKDQSCWMFGSRLPGAVSPPEPERW